MITANEAKERAKAHRLCASFHLISGDKSINVECVRDTANEAIMQAASDGYSSVDIVLSSIEPLNEVLNLDDISSIFMVYGYIIKWSDETIGRAEGIVGQHIMSLKIEW